MSNNVVFQVFVFRDGEFLGTEMVNGLTFVMGRDPACQVLIQDEMASRKHMQITISGQDMVLTDLNSANGTFLNGVRVQGARPLTARDDVRVGRHTFKFKPVINGGTQPSPFASVETDVAPSGNAPAPVPAPAPWAGVPQPPQANARLAAAIPIGGSAPFRPGIDGDRTEDEMMLPQRGIQARAPVPAAPARVSATSSNPSGPSSQPMPATPASTRAPSPSVARMPAAPAPAPAPTPAATRAPELTAPEAQPPPPQHVPHAAHAAHDAHAHDDDDEDDHGDEDVAPGYSLVDLLAREKRWTGGTMLGEVMLLEGDGLKAYAPVPTGAKYVMRLPAETEGKQGKKHTLVTHGKAGVTVNLAVGMRGRVLLGGQPTDIASLLEQKGQTSAQVVLKPGDAASLKTGKDSWLVRVTQAPSQIGEAVKGPLPPPVGERMDRKIFGIASGGSFGAHAALMLVVFIAGLLSPAPRITQLEDEFAEIKMPEMQLEEPPPEPPEPPPPAPPEPTPPPKDIPKPTKQPKARPAGKQPPTPPSGGGANEAKPAQPGILAALTKLPTSRSAGSQSVLAAVSNINAVKVPGGNSSFKVSALIGKGPTNGIQIGGSGGGTETKGLTSILREGGGSGPGALGGKGTAGVRAAPAMALHRQATTQGELSREEIMKVINQHLGEIQFCYEKELLKNPGLQGKVTFEWTINTSGTVVQVKTKVGGLPSPTATNCMMDKIKTWNFPKPRGNGVVLVTYPFVFKQSGF